MDMQMSKRESQLSIVEPTDDSSAESAEETQASAARPDHSRRRRLSHDEEREIARLYAETSTPTSEIRERFGIGDSSLYRVVQRRGLALRGRTASSTQPNPPRGHAPAARRRRSSAASGAQPADSEPRSLAATAEVRPSQRVGDRSSRGPVRRASVTEATTSPAERAASQTGGGARQRFRIRFEGESVLEAKDIRDALRQAESFGATEITAVARED
jgi:transposase-like protein